MEEKRYSVYQNDHPIARNMTIDVALTLVNALCDKYWQERHINFTIFREYNDTEDCAPIDEEIY